MKTIGRLGTAALAAWLHFTSASFAITPVSTSMLGGKTAEQLALQIVDPACGLSVVPGTASFTTNTMVDHEPCTFLVGYVL